jgi:circadian clock protein KaiC
MQDEKKPDIPRLERLPSGIEGFDAVLRGGFFRAGIYIIQGPPGTGKTILGNQLCYNHVAAGGRALYVTLLAESHDRMLSHMRDMTFFHPESIAQSIHYISGFRILEDGGLRGLVDLVRREVIARKATLLALDGLVQAGETATSATQFKKFIHDCRRRRR